MNNTQELRMNGGEYVILCVVDESKTRHPMVFITNGQMDKLLCIVTNYQHQDLTVPVPINDKYVVVVMVVDWCRLLLVLIAFPY